ncbi:MAG: polysaccharide biosynthesis protein [Candidatus Woesearchaeota archaeon]
MLNNKKILVTGGTGSWGQELIKQILQKYNPTEIRIYSRGEVRQVEMKHAFRDSRLTFIIGDVADKERLKEACYGCDVVFHLAALKHVPVCEENQVPAIMTNIIGTMNVIDVAIELGVKMVVDVSSDKAVDPLNFYGVTKSVGEKLIVNANVKRGSTKFVCVRGGNVIGSSGSVIPLFRRQISTMNKITITDKRMTRFLFSLRDAIALIFKAMEKSVGGEIFVMKMPAVRIVDLAEVMIEKLGNNNTRIEYIGIRPGEKIHEVLVSRYEKERVVEDSDYFIILPYIQIPEINKKYKNVKPAELEGEYSSDKTRILEKKEIWATIQKSGYLDKTDAIIDKLDFQQLKHIATKEKWVI